MGDVFRIPISRIDPKTNTVVPTFQRATEAMRCVVLGWARYRLSNLRAGTVWRIDPKKLMAVKAE